MKMGHWLSPVLSAMNDSSIQPHYSALLPDSAKIYILVRRKEFMKGIFPNAIGAHQLSIELSFNELHFTLYQLFINFLVKINSIAIFNERCTLPSSFIFPISS